MLMVIRAMWMNMTGEPTSMPRSMALRVLSAYTLRDDAKQETNQGAKSHV
jgi:hypothetical protein